ncbi:hypothetical protein M405DRAFT_838688 [Rhizopogon salebrosus TDB-379]|nr:hypothetical protein M405DRAFT_838688 [Rhizopogon salebrosus TDB-379]
MPPRGRIPRDNTFVEPGDVNEALTGAMVEVFFAIKHYYMRDKKFDTFQADIQQIQIVKLVSWFKRPNAREGPLDHRMSSVPRPRRRKIKKVRIAIALTSRWGPGAHRCGPQCGVSFGDRSATLFAV